MGVPAGVCGPPRAQTGLRLEGSQTKDSPVSQVADSLSHPPPLPVGFSPQDRYQPTGHPLYDALPRDRFVTRGSPLGLQVVSLGPSSTLEYQGPRTVRPWSLSSAFTPKEVKEVLSAKGKGPSPVESGRRRDTNRTHLGLVTYTNSSSSGIWGRRPVSPFLRGRNP